MVSQMNEFQKLIAFLKVSYNNLTTLHRNLTGCEWFPTHEKLSEYYEYTAEVVDDLAEIGISLGYAEPTVADSVLMFQPDVLPAQPRDSPESLRLTMGIFRSVAGMMDAASPSTPPDVQNKILEYRYWFNKEANYKLARAIGNSTTLNDDDDD